MPQIIGSRDTVNIGSNKIIVDMADDIALLTPSAAPLTIFLRKTKSKVRKVHNPEFDWLEDDLNARWDAINNGAGYLAGDTDIVVDNVNFFLKGDLVKIPRTGEVIRVTAVNYGTNTLTVVRSVGDTAAAALVDNDPLLIIGNSNAEGAGTREINTTIETKVTNFTQIFKTPFGVTNTQKSTKTYGGTDLNYQQAKKGKEHNIDMERAFVFGEKSKITNADNGKPERTAAGLLSFLSANRYDAAGALTQAEFDQYFCELIFSKGAKEKLFLASARMVSVINNWAMGKLEFRSGETTYGLNIAEYKTPFGILHITYDPILEGAVYGGYGIAIDVDNIAYAPMAERDTKLETNIQANDADERKDQYITEASIEVKLPLTHGVIYGVTG